MPAIAAPMTDVQFQRLFHEALERNLEPDAIPAFLALGDNAMIVRDTALEDEDAIYFLDDLSRLLRLKSPDGERVFRFWNWNIFDRKPKYDISEFSVGQLRNMARESRWSPAVMRRL